MDEQIEQIATAMAKRWLEIEPNGEFDGRVWGDLARAAHSVMVGTIAELAEALTDARNNILSLLGGFRDDMPDAAVKLFQAQARQIDAALAPPRHD